MIVHVHAMYCWTCACGWVSPDGHNGDRPASREVAQHRRNCSEAIYSTRMWENRTVVQIVHPVICECEQWTSEYMEQRLVDDVMTKALLHHCVRVDP
jgi:hypothetical protein